MERGKKDTHTMFARISFEPYETADSWAFWPMVWQFNIVQPNVPVCGLFIKQHILHYVNIKLTLEQ